MKHGQSATGELVRHIIETHPASRDTMVEVEPQGTKICDYLNKYVEGVAEREWAALISYLARWHFFYGDLWGNRSPVNVSVGGRALCYYLTKVFIALQTRHIVDLMNEASHSIRSISCREASPKTRY